VKENIVVSIQQPETSQDALTQVLRQGAWQLLKQAIELEVEEFILRYQDLRDELGRSRVVRNGHLPQREIQTGIGGVKVRVPRVRDRGTGAESPEKIRFRSSLVPPYLRRSKSVEELLPLLYLKGISTGDFSEALSALLGSEAPGLSANTISRLKQGWKQDYEQWCQRDLSKGRYIYIWIDGIHCQARREDARICLLVVIGARADGSKEVLAVEDGYRESEQSWLELLTNLRSRGLTIDPKLAIGDGALGFWKALPQVFGKTRHQRCWVHKTANVLNRLPKSVQPKAKQSLQQIWMAESRETANRAFDSFLEAYGSKYPKSTSCLVKDREQLLSFYDFPAEHWQHLRTTNPIESTFATVRLRTAKTRNCLSRQTLLTMVFKLSLSAQKRWRRLRGYRRLGDVVKDVRFIDGIREDEVAA